MELLHHDQRQRDYTEGSSVDPEEYSDSTDPGMILFTTDQELTHAAITIRDTEPDDGLFLTSNC